MAQRELQPGLVVYALKGHAWWRAHIHLSSATANIPSGKVEPRRLGKIGSTFQRLQFELRRGSSSNMYQVPPTVDQCDGNARGDAKTK